ncbi:MAG: beta-lactamase family protein [Gammaproteobacteria bacterium]|nr:beta-lactamase family protein [Gammaproteobacteria bacterium]
MNINDIDQFLSARDLPSVVALATNEKEVIYEGAFGVGNTQTQNQVNIDTPHAIMSMTKPITSLAIMRLVESGDIGLDDPASIYVPKYRDMVVLGETDLKLKTYSTRPLTRDFTIRDLLSHTAGFGYSFCNETLAAFGEEGESDAFPLTHQPGEAWSYGTNTRVLGEIICAVTGNDLYSALSDLIFEPLGMQKTSYMPQDNQVYPHVRSGDTWAPIERFPNMPFGDRGLISTARDYAMFLRCLLNDGAPLLRYESFQSMINNQIGDLYITEQPAAIPNFTHPFPTGAGVDKFGLGFQLHLNPGPGMRSTGSYSWCGLLNTFFWGDPSRKVGGIVLMQLLPLYEPVCLETLSGFERRIYQD